MSYDLQKAARLKHLQEMGSALDTKKANAADVYTKDEVDSKIGSAAVGTYIPSGSVTFANLPAADADHLGRVYNVTDAFVTTASFVEGADKSYPAGTNVQIVAGETSGTYFYDALAGFVDLSGYSKVTASDTNGCINVDGSDVTVVEFATDEEFEELMNDMFGTTA